MRTRIRRLLRGEMPLGYVIYKVLNYYDISLFHKISLKLYEWLFLKKQNILDENTRQLHIDTYDCYNQLTHPDIIEYNGKVFMCATPYTYSNEKVENPCLFYYCLESKEFAALGNQPIINWKKEEYRHHYSDPALLVENEKLTMFYRDSIHKDDSTRLDVIYKIQTENGIDWSKPVIIQFNSASVIAPSFCKKEKQVEVYYVIDGIYDGIFGTKLFRGLYSNNNVSDVLEIKINNQPHNMCIWHTDVKYYGGFYHGLFTYMSKPGEGETRLYDAVSDDGITWYIENQITFGVTSNVENIYKSTSYYIENKKYIIASAMDSYSRWFLYCREMEE